MLGIVVVVDSLLVVMFILEAELRRRCSPRREAYNVENVVIQDTVGNETCVATMAQDTCQLALVVFGGVRRRGCDDPRSGPLPRAGVNKDKDNA